MWRGLKYKCPRFKITLSSTPKNTALLPLVSGPTYFSSASASSSGLPSWTHSGVSRGDSANCSSFAGFSLKVSKWKKKKHNHIGKKLFTAKHNVPRHTATYSITIQVLHALTPHEKNTSWGERQRTQSFLATTVTAGGKWSILRPASGAVKYSDIHMDRFCRLLKNANEVQLFIAITSMHKLHKYCMYYDEYIITQKF